MVVGEVYTDGILRCILKALLFWSLFMKFIDRTGQRFGKLVVVEEAGRDANKKVLWRCVCDCGGETVLPSGSLVTGNTTSCGCVVPNLKHGGWKKSSYNTWRAMVRRCHNPKDKDYKRYGAKGIVVCNRWQDYLNFELDMGEPIGTATLHRVDPYGNYEPANCEWASPTRQAREIRTPKTSKTGVTGVLLHNGYYYGTITVKKKKYYSKCFATLEEAAAARKELEALHWNKE